MNQYGRTTPVWTTGARMCAAVATVLVIIGTGNNTIFQVAHGQARRELHVSPTGAATNDGSAQRPLDLATALSNKSPAKPGDIIWLHGGTYRGSFKSQIAGTATAPIIVRQYPGERATIDNGSTGGDALSVVGAHTWFWGFEITSSHTKRTSAEPYSWPTDIQRGYGGVTRAHGTKFINLIVHDNANGIGLWTESVGGEAYGNVVYYNGWQAPDRAHGHGIYTQNASAARLIAENIIFSQFSHGVHAYGSAAAALNSITLEGNIAFNNGALGTGGIYANGRDLLLGGYQVAANPVLADNATYGAQSNLGYSAGCSNGRVTNNYFVGGLALINCVPAMTGNDIFDPAWPKDDSKPTQFPQNTFHTTQPTGTIIRVRPNKYEVGRANIVVYNWGSAAAVPVDISAAKLPVGAAYQIRDAQDYFGRPVVEGVYDGRPVNLVMSGLKASTPVGNVSVVPPHTAPKFAAFVVVPRTTSTTTPTPPAEPDPSVTLTLSDTSIAPGHASTLSWSATNASNVSVDQGIGTVGMRGSMTVSPGVTTTYTAVATDSTGQTARAQVTLQVTSTPTEPEAPGPTAPSGPSTMAVRLTAPANNTIAKNQGTVTLGAEASASATKVEFYRGASIIGTAWKAPFTLQWSYVPSGTYAITARAYDKDGRTATSGAATLRVTQPPTVHLTSPRAGGHRFPSTVTLTAVTTDIDGTIARVEYYRDSTLIGQATAPPYTVNWPALLGTHVLTARAIDNVGLATTSAPVRITVADGPLVRLVAPSPSGVYINQGVVPLQAVATSRAGRITKVEFYRNGLLIGTAPAAPFKLDWAYVPTGTYTITAKAYTDTGLVGQSGPTNIVVRSQ